MKREDIFKKLKDIFAKIDEELQSQGTEIAEETNLLKDLGFSSLDMIYMAVLIEDTFGIRLDPEAGMKVRTVAEAIDMIEKQADGKKN